MQFNSLPSNVKAAILSYIANDPNASWNVLLRYRQTSKLFAQEILKQLKTVKIDESHYCSVLRKRCGETDKAKAATIVSDFTRSFLPKISLALHQLCLPRVVMHEAAAADLPVGPLDSVRTLHMVVCSADTFTFVDHLSRATPSVNTLILEYPRLYPCSRCVPHQIDRFWDAARWDANQLQRLAFVGFTPPVGRDDLIRSRCRYLFCCDAPALGNMFDNRLYNCRNLIALDLRYAGLDNLGSKPLGSNFPLLQELRLGFNEEIDTIDCSIFGDEAVPSRLGFLELWTDFGVTWSYVYDLHFFSRLQLLSRLTHLHMQCDFCGTQLGEFFRNQDIQLTRVAIRVKHWPNIIKDVIDGNPGLEVFYVDGSIDTERAALYDYNIDAMFAGIAGLSELKALICTIRFRPKSPQLQCLNLLSPQVHTKLQLVAVQYMENPPDMSDICGRLRARFEGHVSSGRRFELYDGNVKGVCEYGNKKAMYKHINQNYPDFACCVQRMSGPASDEFRWDFPWKNESL